MYNEQNNGCMITFYSSAHVQKAQKLLTSAGIKSVQTRPPSGITGGSCAYALIIGKNDVQAARLVLSQVRYGGVFCRVNGSYRKV